MYSFAMILWELATVQVPFAEVPAMAVGLRVKICYCEVCVYVNSPRILMLCHLSSLGPRCTPFLCGHPKVGSTRVEYSPHITQAQPSFCSQAMIT